MIKTTIAVTASLLLVACGAGKEPQSHGDSSVAANHAPASNEPANDAAATKAPAAKSELTLTYFNLDG
jgi:uncharacterized protein YcfL